MDHPTRSPAKSSDKPKRSQRKKPQGSPLGDPAGAAPPAPPASPTPSKPKRPVGSSSRAIARQRTSRVAAPVAEPLQEGHPLLDFAPYLHKAPRANSITPTKQRRFVAELAASGIVTHAAIKIGASMEALYKLRHRKGAEDFAAAWDRAVDAGIARLEDCALERAIVGEERPVVSMGRVVASYTKHDTQLILFFLRNRRRKRYGPEALVEDDYDPDAIIESINAKLDLMRARDIEAGKWREEDEE